MDVGFRFTQSDLQLLQLPQLMGIVGWVERSETQHQHQTKRRSYHQRRNLH